MYIGSGTPNIVCGGWGVGVAILVLTCIRLGFIVYCIHVKSLEIRLWNV